MTVVKALAKIFAKFALTILLFWAAFTFLFHFGESQPLGLGLAFALAIDIASSRKPPEQAVFAPHLPDVYGFGHSKFFTLQNSAPFRLTTAIP